MKEINNPEQDKDISLKADSPKQLRQYRRNEQQADDEMGSMTIKRGEESSGVKIDPHKKDGVSQRKLGAVPESDNLKEKQVEEPSVKLRNTERTLNGRELTEDDAKVNNKFRGDQFEAKKSYNESIPLEKRKAYVEANAASTCPFNENLSGNIKTNDEYKAKMTDEQKQMYSELRQKRNEVSEVTEDTVMQKVITEDVYKKYICGEFTTISGCASKASDAAPYTNNVEEAYKNLRLEYKNSPFTDSVNNNGDMYVLRFTSSYCPTNSDYPVIKESNCNIPPCTESGFVGSEKQLIPEYEYRREDKRPITAGAIYKVDHEGNETVVAVWDDDLGRFRQPEEKGDE